MTATMLEKLVETQDRRLRVKLACNLKGHNTK